MQSGGRASVGERWSAGGVPAGCPTGVPGGVVVRGHAAMLARCREGSRRHVSELGRAGVARGLWTARARSARRQGAAGVAAGFEAGAEGVVVEDEEDDSAGFDDDADEDEPFDEEVFDDRASFR